MQEEDQGQRSIKEEDSSAPMLRVLDDEHNAIQAETGDRLVSLLSVERALAKFVEHKLMSHVPFSKREAIWMVLWKLLNETAR